MDWRDNTGESTMKNKLVTTGIILLILLLTVYTTSLDILGSDTLLAGITIIGIAIFLRLLPRQLDSIFVNTSAYTFETGTTHVDGELIEVSINMDSNAVLRPSLAKRKVILTPPNTNPINWANTPAEISEGESVTYKYKTTSNGTPNIQLDETYGKFNAQIHELPSQLEVYDYFTHKQIETLQIQED
jgi:hypothetical protein